MSPRIQRGPSGEGTSTATNPLKQMAKPPFWSLSIYCFGIRGKALFLKMKEMGGKVPILSQSTKDFPPGLGSFSHSSLIYARTLSFAFSSLSCICIQDTIISQKLQMLV
uniref:Uncharacterized protein n=1 Tax=Opuntia streptacantha TaxID=393608 RepID=A0A7C8YN66_OPUST